MKDILIAYIDNFKAFGEEIRTIYPETEVQLKPKGVFTGDMALFK